MSRALAYTFELRFCNRNKCCFAVKMLGCQPTKDQLLQNNCCNLWKTSDKFIRDVSDQRSRHVILDNCLLIKSMMTDLPPVWSEWHMFECPTNALNTFIVVTLSSNQKTTVRRQYVAAGILHGVFLKVPTQYPHNCDRLQIEFSS